MLRPLALLLGVVLLHLVFVESGYACQMLPSVMSAPAGARMDAGVRTGMQMTAGSAAAVAPGSDPAQHRPPCRFPWAPDGCQFAGPCAPAALASGVVILRPTASARSAPPRAAPLAPTFLRLPPELPPPRA